jgi:hypothetical protein
MVWWWCDKHCGVLLVSLVWPNGLCAFSSRALPPSCWFSLVAVVLPAPLSVSVTELLVSYFTVCITQLWSDPLLPCDVVVVTGLVHRCVVPRLKRTDTSLDHLYSMIQLAKYFALVWE